MVYSLMTGGEDGTETYDNDSQLLECLDDIKHWVLCTMNSGDIAHLKLTLAIEKCDEGEVR